MRSLWPKLKDFLNGTPKTIPDRQKYGGIQKSKKMLNHSTPADAVSAKSTTTQTRCWRSQQLRGHGQDCAENFEGS